MPAIVVGITGDHDVKCEGHMPEHYQPQGETFYCDGTCRPGAKKKPARVKVKRASYRDAVDAIAQNDEPAELDVDTVAGLASVVIVASIFGVPAEQLAADVVALRERTA